jgi:GntR family transcriptional regulator
MLAVTDPMDPTPLYEQVANLIAARIEAGELEPRDPIPSELAIQQEYGVARGTARKAVEVLRDRGLVVTIPQRGSYVADRT